MRSVWLPAFVALAACGEPEATVDTSPTAGFCETLDDGHTYVVEEGGGNDSSGMIYARLITDEVEEVNDPLYIAFKAYTLENVDQGGVQTTGQTSGDGIVEELVGAGTWHLQAAYPRGSRTCLAEMQFPVEAGNTTWVCPVMTCPD